MAAERSDDLEVLHVVGGTTHLGGVMAFVNALASDAIPGIRQSVWKHRGFVPPPGSTIRWVLEGDARQTDVSSWRDLLGGLADAPRLLAWRRRHPRSVLYAHSRMGMISAAVAARLSGAPLMMHMHARASRPALYRWVWRTGRASVFFNSRLTCLHYGCDPSSAGIIMPPIRWPEGPTHNDSSRPDSRPQIIGAGMFVPWKNTHTIVEGFKVLSKEVRNAQLALYGNSPELESAYQEQIMESARGHPIEFRGWDPNWRARLQSTDVFVHAAQHEPFGIVMLEAFAHGCRLVVPSETFLDDLPTPLNKLGIERVERPDATGYSDAMRKALALPVPPGGFWEVRKTISAQFSARGINTRLAEHYRRIAGLGSRK